MLCYLTSPQQIYKTLKKELFPRTKHDLIKVRDIPERYHQNVLIQDLDYYSTYVT